MEDPKLTNKQKQNRADQTEQTREYKQSGFGGSARKEAFPVRIPTEAEDVWNGLSNSHIVLGKDRVDEVTTGYGGRGKPESGMVHIVAGHYGANLREYSPTSELGYSNPNFMFDSSYIYLSQRSDIDSYLQLTDGKVGKSTDKSCVAIKADDVRIVGERGIKLVTTRYKEDSRRQQSVSLKGIDLIAGNDSKDLQGIVKGDNTKAAFTELTKILNEIIGMITSLAMYQMKANAAIAEHEHMTNVPAEPTLPQKTVISVTCNGANQYFNDRVIEKGKTVSKRISDFKNSYLDVFGEKYISSRYNHTN